MDMSEDMSNLMNQINHMIKNNQIPEEIQNIVGNLSQNMKSNSQDNSQVRTDSANDNNISSSNSNSQESSELPELDIATIMKMKNLMDSMKSNKDDPRANLLRSLKPYLKESRKSKIEQYIQIFSMGKVFETFNSLGGENKK